MLALGAVFALVLLNGFFVATEFALVAVRRTRVQQLAAAGDRRAKTVLSRLDHLDTYIAATQLGITISSLALGWIGEPALAHLINPLLDRVPGLSSESQSALTHTISFVIAFSVITALHIVLGELAPKSLALQRPEQTSLIAAGPLHAFYLVFRPIIFALNHVGNAVVRAFGIEPAKGHELVQSAEELQLSVDASREAGLVGELEHDLVDRAFAFSDLAVRHVMVPRTEMSGIPVDATLHEVLTIAADSGFTRLPVYDGDPDHIVGILNIKRLIPMLAERCLESAVMPAVPFTIQDYLREPVRVPESVPAPAVLSRLRSAGAQIAVVLDEYGGTAGIVSLEDLVESLIGTTPDDEEELAEPPHAPNGDLMLDGLTPLFEVRDLHGLDLNGEELGVETLGGWVFATLGRTATPGDTVTLPDQTVLQVEEMDGLRIARVRVVCPRPEPEPTPDATLLPAPA